MNPCIVVQARMSSSRFPGKMLAPIAGVPCILRCLERCKGMGLPIILATSDDPSDDALAELAKSEGFHVFRGALNDVRERIYQASDGFDIVVRITGDCPFVDPGLIRECLSKLIAYDYDYVTNTMPPTFPDGLDVEVFKRDRISTAHPAVQEMQAEHVTSNFRFLGYRTRNVSQEPDRSCHSLTLDDPDDIPGLERYLEDGTLPTKPRNAGMVDQFLAYMRKDYPDLCTTQSDKLRESIASLIPGGAQTFSKMPHRWCEGFGPSVQRGSYLKAEDIDGNLYMDFVRGLGASTDPSMGPRSMRPQSFTLPSRSELLTAQAIVKMYPGAEMVRFFKNGSDATAAAVRLARHYTQCSDVITYGYHGWQDVFCVEEAFGPMNSGSLDDIVDDSAMHHYDSYDALLSHLVEFEDCGRAAVIIEPCNQNVPTRDQLQQIRDICTRSKTLLIFDEVVTCPRLAMGGAAEYFGITPDLACLGKGLANGAALSVLCGKREYMEAFTGTFVSTTFGGEVSALDWCRENLDGLREAHYPEMCWELGAQIHGGYNRLVAELGMEKITSCVGIEAWPIITFRDYGKWSSMQLYTFFQQECLRRHVLFNGSHFFAVGHTDDDIADLLCVYHDVLILLRAAIGFDILDRVTLGKINTGGVRRA